jgi:preprotein translocase subunit SecA
MRLFNSSLAESMMTRAGFPEDMPLESKIVTRGIQSAQSQVESRNFEIRKNVLKYDDVMSRQRVVIYEQRRRVLEGEDLHEQVRHFRSDVLTAYITGATTEGRPEDWDLDALWTALKAVYPVSITPDEVVEQAGGATRLSAELIEREILSDAEHAYSEREEQIGSENMRQLERRVTLSVLDRKWREHLYEMDYLKEGIGLRAMAQRDPLVEYQREGFDMFNAMLDSLKEEAVGFLFNLQVEQAEPEPQPEPQPAAAVPGGGNGQSPNGHHGDGEGRHARPVPEQPQQPEADPVPTALRGKGLDGSAASAGLTFSGPSEGGGVQSRGNDDGRSAGSGSGAPAGGTRRERRAAARQQAKKNKKSTRG